MRRIPISARMSCIVLICLALLILPISGICVAQPAERATLVMFPFAISEGVNQAKAEFTEQHAGDLFVLVKEGFEASGRFSVVPFERRIASVQRAVREQRLSEAELLRPLDTFSGIEKARKLAAFTGAQYAVIGSIDRYVADTAKGEAQLMATLQFIEVGGEGRVETIVATGHGTGSAVEGESIELVAGTAATYDAAEKLLTDITSVVPESPRVTTQVFPVWEEQPVSAKKDKGLIPMMIGALLLGFLIGGG